MFKDFLNSELGKKLQSDLKSSAKAGAEGIKGLKAQLDAKIEEDLKKWEEERKANPTSSWIQDFLNQTGSPFGAASTKPKFEYLTDMEGKTKDEIKHAYRKQAQKLHPDVNKEPDAEEKFRKLNEEYDWLTARA